MNKEIKEILDYLKKKENTRRIKCITIEESKLLLDYITKINEKYDEALECIDELKNEVEELNRMCEIYGKSLYNAELTDHKSRIDKVNKLLNNHDIDIGDIYYKYNNRYVKSELKERIREITGGDEE